MTFLRKLLEYRMEIYDLRKENDRDIDSYGYDQKNFWKSRKKVRDAGKVKIADRKKEMGKELSDLIDKEPEDNKIFCYQRLVSFLLIN